MDYISENDVSLVNFLSVIVCCAYIEKMSYFKLHEETFKGKIS